MCACVQVHVRTVIGSDMVMVLCLPGIPMSVLRLVSFSHTTLSLTNPTCITVISSDGRVASASWSEYLQHTRTEGHRHTHTHTHGHTYSPCTHRHQFRHALPPKPVVLQV